MNEEVRASLDALPLDVRASFQRIVELIQAHGLEHVREPYAKHLEGALGNAHERTARAVYVVVVHVFAKKTEKRPRREIITALKRAQEVS